MYLVTRFSHVTTPSVCIPSPYLAESAVVSGRWGGGGEEEARGDVTKAHLDAGEGAGHTEKGPAVAGQRGVTQKGSNMQIIPLEYSK